MRQVWVNDDNYEAKFKNLEIVGLAQGQNWN